MLFSTIMRYLDHGASCLDASILHPRLRLASLTHFWKASGTN
jgi:hypothetical protein